MTALQTLRRLWPGTLFGRLALIFFAGLVAAHTLSFALVFMERGAAARAMMLSYMARDLASSIAILERVPAPERAAWLPLLARRNYRFVLDVPLPAQAVDSALARQVIAAVGQVLEPGRRVLASAPSKQDAGVSLRLHLLLADGSPLAIALSDPGVAVSPWVLAVLAAQLLLLLLLTWYAVRLATRPLAQLARAADALGPGTPVRPLAEEGPREVVLAARAFNALQRRIETHLTERLHILAAVSHDLQTPITRMRLRAELLEDPVLRDKLLSDLDAMQALVHEGIAYARSAHSAGEQPTRVSLHALLDSLVCDYRDAGHTVHFNESLDLTLATRPQALRRIVSNLLDNALKFAGAVELLATRNAAGTQLSICVQDRGPGIPQHELTAVLQPFYRLESSRSRETGGAGLGLAIAEQLAASLGATLSLRNRDGGGLQACLRIPLGPKS